jgi:hypothetical protein
MNIKNILTKIFLIVAGTYGAYWFGRLAFIPVGGCKLGNVGGMLCTWIVGLLLLIAIILSLGLLYHFIDDRIEYDANHQVHFYSKRTGREI